MKDFFKLMLFTVHTSVTLVFVLCWFVQKEVIEYLQNKCLTHGIATWELDQEHYPPIKRLVFKEVTNNIKQ